MPANESFDITTGVDLQEVDNAVNQALKEIGQRYDFKGVRAEIEYDRRAAKLVVTTTDDYKLDAIWGVLQDKMIRRGVAVKNLHRGRSEKALGDHVRQEIELQQALSADTQREIVKLIKARGFKKLQAQVQGDAVRVSGPSRDELQAVILLLKEQDYGVELKFGNYRS
jgi:uncharacterized protein YajQ (UPF0234 family)